MAATRIKSQAERSAWARYEQAMWGRGLDYYRERLHRLNAEGGKLLDLGSGPGQWSAAAASEGFSVTRCDRLFPGTSGHAGWRAKIPFVATEASQLPFLQDCFDTVLCNLVLPYVPVEECIQEVARVLRPGGTFFGICHGPGYYLMQATREVWHAPRGASRRLLVLGYTLIHRVLGLQRYRYETFQWPSHFEKLLRAAGLEIIWVRLGGHPLMPETRFARLPVFFEFLASKKQPRTLVSVHSQA
jgi:SAM-dependent methyltransferase